MKRALGEIWVLFLIFMNINSWVDLSEVVY